MAGLSFEPQTGVTNKEANAAFKKGLNKVYTWYTGGFVAFVILLAILEQMGMPKAWIGYSFLAATVLLYAGIGVMSRTNDAAEVDQLCNQLISKLESLRDTKKRVIQQEISSSSSS